MTLGLVGQVRILRHIHRTYFIIGTLANRLKYCATTDLTLLPSL